jgi:tetratricopeptide (TPR) repeat protein
MGAIREHHATVGRNALAAGDWLTAQNAYKQILDVDRFDVEALVNCGLVFQSTGRMPAAIALYRRALAIKREFAQLYNLAYCLGHAGQFEECAAAMANALEIAPNDEARAMCGQGLGVALYSLGRWDEAIAAYDRVLHIKPGDVDTIDQRGLALLGRGDYVAGLIDNKIRWSVLVSHPLMHSDLPQWQGEDLTGKTICVLHEQGFGDTFQFVRFVARLKDMGAARTMLSVPETLKDVFEASGVADDVIDVQAVPVCDYIVPMMTVPAYLGLRIETIPYRAYLRAPARDVVLPDSGRRKIGLCWGGKSQYAQDQWRSMALMDLLPILELTGCDFYALQADDRAKELWQTGLGALATNCAPLIRTWGDTAAILDQLDAVVSVDTGLAHLAGAMGKPVHLMIAHAACWRWHDHDTTRTRWYDGHRLYRQTTQGDWSPVVAAVKDALANLAAR